MWISIDAVGLCIFAFIVVMGLLYKMQEGFIFFPSRLNRSIRFPLEVPNEERYIISDGLKIDSLFLRAKDAPGTILYFHGNRDTLEYWSMICEDIVNRTGWNVWAMDYPGFGKSEGYIWSEEQLHRIARKFLADLQNGNPLEHKVVVYGRSLGSGLATKLAAENKVDALVLETPYVSIQRRVREIMPFLPTSWILKYTMRTDLWIPFVKCPTYIVHGTRDLVIPFRHSRKLIKLAKAALTWVPIRGASHSNLTRFPAYWITLKSFLRMVAETPANANTRDDFIAP